MPSLLTIEQMRVTDHRLSMSTTNNVEDVLDGGLSLDAFHEAMEEQDRQDRLEAFMEDDA